MNIDQLPQFEFGYLNLLFNNYIFQIIFFTAAITTIINGQNIIDGTNGLSALTSMTIFASLWYTGFLVEDYNLMSISFTILLLLISFIIFNYPYGKIFLGDTGSYFLGLLAAYMTIQTFANNPELPSWSAVIILFYPTLEVVFSYFRKISQHKSPFLPDNQHLHLKIYHLLSKDSPQRRLYNALVAPFLSIIWLTPLTLLPLSFNFPHLSMIVLLALIIIYLFFYFSIPSPSYASKK
jgi:UDP-N-acetylmuramyl pentapeptide phosphotransferase/UDP-N-acetylglucosamine-1-phosphate transferase